MLSFWERNSFTTYDIIIVGSGITGLSCAASLKEKNPTLKILVLEKGVFPTGASTKNAGFACFGSLTELISDLEGMSTDEMLKLVELRWNGLNKLRQRLGDEKMGLLNYGGYELITKNEQEKLNHLDDINNSLKSIFNENVFHHADEKLSSFKFNRQIVKHLIFNPFESQIDTGLMMKSLLAYCRELDIDILNGVNVTKLEEEDTHMLIETTSDAYFKAEKVIVATNAFTKTLHPEVELKPGRGIVLITHPIANLPFKGTFQYDQGYYYFRNFGDRILLGGARNLDFENEITTKFEINETIMSHLKSTLSNVIIPGREFTIDQSWAGIMAFGPTKQPIVKKQSNKLYFGVRLGGMGVAIGSMIGEKLADMVSMDG